ncbi:XF1762 family protein [Hymenobacter glacieicola]|uniref:XF1762 family protein n=1 Tax=Hymenobacter glacieicola TaxID=1562124 RepID=UPI0035715314
MKIRTASLKEANEFVAAHHRHNDPVRGHKFSLALEVNGVLVGVCIVGRPKARGFDNGRWFEVVRLCTDGTRNACSKLYAAARAAARALGYEQLLTYTLSSETGASLRASGWRKGHTTDGGSWDTPSRRRKDTAPTEPKICWFAL